MGSIYCGPDEHLRTRRPDQTGEIHHLLGLVMIALTLPAAIALVAFVRAQAGLREWIGPTVYLAFVAPDVVVDYVWLVEFRSPMRYGILVPCLLLLSKLPPLMQVASAPTG